MDRTRTQRRALELRFKGKRPLGWPRRRQSKERFKMARNRKGKIVGWKKQLDNFHPTIRIKQQEVLGRTNRLFSLTRHRPHWKRRVQQFFYCCVCIRYRGNVSTEPLPSNDRRIFTEPLSSNDKGICLPSRCHQRWGIHIQTHRLMGGIF
jgi:hypothetical protein